MKQRQPGLSWLAFPAALTFLMLGWQGWHAYSSYDFGQEIAAKVEQTEEWRNRILTLDHHRQLSEEMAVTTGDVRRREQYEAATRAFIERVAELVDQPARGAALSRLQAAIADLHSAEAEISERLAEGDRPAAQALAMDPAHVARHAALIEALDTYVGETRRNLDALLIAEQHDELLSLGVSALMLMTSLVVWSLLIVRVRQAQRRFHDENVQRTRAESALQKAQKMEALGRMAGGIAHDFNNILVAIVGFTDLAHRHIADEHAATQSLMRIKDAVAQAQDVVRGLFSLSRNATVLRVPTDLGAVVSHTVKLIEGLLPARIQLSTDIDPQSPVWVLGDQSQLQQMVLNLAVNSRDAVRGDGRIFISARRIRGAKDATPPSLTKAQLEVRDTGEGIRPEVLEHIFEPFFTTRTRERGSGLGLAIVHGIVNEHGGNIQVSSEPGRGTKITIELPSIEVPAEVTLGLTSLVPDERESSGLVLIAEGYRQVRELIVETLGIAGFEILQAESGSETLRLFNQHQEAIRLLVIDYDLRRSSGLDCVRTIRDKCAQLPIIMIASTSADDLEDVLAGEALLLRKPFPMVELVRLVQRMTVGVDHTGPS